MPRAVTRCHAGASGIRGGDHARGPRAAAGKRRRHEQWEDDPHGVPFRDVSYCRYAYTSKQRRPAGRLRPERPPGGRGSHRRTADTPEAQEPARAGALASWGFEGRYRQGGEALGREAAIDRQEGSRCALEEEALSRMVAARP